MDNERFGKLVVMVRDEFGDHVAIGGVPTRIYFRSASSGESKPEAAEKQVGQSEPNLNGYQPVWEGETDDAGRVSYEGPAGIYLAVATAFRTTFWGRTPVRERYVEEIELLAQVDLKVTARRVRDGKAEECETFTSGDTVEFLAQHRDLGIPLTYKWKLDGGLIIGSPGQKIVVQMNKPGSVKSEVTISGSARMTTSGTAVVVPQTPQLINGSVGVTLRRTATAPTSDLPLWVVIRKSTEAISWDNYSRFMDLVLCGIGKNP